MPKKEGWGKSLHDRVRVPSAINPSVPFYRMRNWVKDKLPNGPEGFVYEDINGIHHVAQCEPVQIVRVYGEGFGTDDEGRFLFLELKMGRDTELDRAQHMTFGLVHRLLRKADPQRERYQGFYRINYTHKDWAHPNCKWWINGHEILGEAALIRWFEKCRHDCDLLSLFENDHESL